MLPALTTSQQRGGPVPLQHGAAGGGGCDHVSVRGPVALVEVGAADVVGGGGGGEVLRGLLRPAELLLGLAVDLDGVQHGDAGGVDRGSDLEGEDDQMFSRCSQSIIQTQSRYKPKPYNEYWEHLIQVQILDCQHLFRFCWVILR